MHYEVKQGSVAVITQAARLLYMLRACRRRSLRFLNIILLLRFYCYNFNYSNEIISGFNYAMWPTHITYI